MIQDNILTEDNILEIALNSDYTTAMNILQSSKTLSTHISDKSFWQEHFIRSSSLRSIVENDEYYHSSILILYFRSCNFIKEELTHTMVFHRSIQVFNECLKADVLDLQLSIKHIARSDHLDFAKLVIDYNPDSLYLSLLLVETYYCNATKIFSHILSLNDASFDLDPMDLYLTRENNCNSIILDSKYYQPEHGIPQIFNSKSIEDHRVISDDLNRSLNHSNTSAKKIANNISFEKYYDLLDHVSFSWQILMIGAFLTAKRVAVDCNIIMYIFLQNYLNGQSSNDEFDIRMRFPNHSLPAQFLLIHSMYKFTNTIESSVNRYLTITIFMTYCFNHSSHLSYLLLAMTIFYNYRMIKIHPHIISVSETLVLLFNLFIIFATIYGDSVIMNIYLILFWGILHPIIGLSQRTLESSALAVTKLLLVIFIEIGYLDLIQTYIIAEHLFTARRIQSPQSLNLIILLLKVYCPMFYTILLIPVTIITANMNCYDLSLS